MMSYITKIQKSKFACINYVNWNIVDKVAILNSVYIFILQCNNKKDIHANTYLLNFSQLWNQRKDFENEN